MYSITKNSQKKSLGGVLHGTVEIPKISLSEKTQHEPSGQLYVQS